MLTFRSVHVAIENVDASLMQGGNYVMASARLGSPGYTGANMAAQMEITSFYVILRETLVHKSIYGQFTMTTTVDRIINANT